ncbi:putative protein without homology [Propionibacterium freudenreichii subsp. shermanii]|nr:putative protein without homology [Propionibacterium freudenreichii subsp. shermanii]
MRATPQEAGASPDRALRHDGAMSHRAGRRTVSRRAVFHRGGLHPVGRHGEDGRVVRRPTPRLGVGQILGRSHAPGLAAGVVHTYERVRGHHEISRHLHVVDNQSPEQRHLWTSASGPARAHNSSKNHEQPAATDRLNLDRRETTTLIGWVHVFRCPSIPRRCAGMAGRRAHRPPCAHTWPRSGAAPQAGPPRTACVVHRRR